MLLSLFSGKGPQKEYYKSKIESLNWKHVKFCLPWLKAEDYPVFLGKITKDLSEDTKV